FRDHVGAAALEDLVLDLAHDAVEVAARRAGIAGVAFAGDAQLHALLDAGRDLELELLRERLLARAAALRARILQRRSLTLAARARGRHGEEALVPVEL